LTHWLVEEEDTQTTNKGNLIDQWSHNNSNSSLQLKQKRQNAFLQKTQIAE